MDIFPSHAAVAFMKKIIPVIIHNLSELGESRRIFPDAAYHVIVPGELKLPELETLYQELTNGRVFFFDKLDLTVTADLVQQEAFANLLALLNHFPQMSLDLTISGTEPDEATLAALAKNAAIPVYLYRKTANTREKMSLPAFEASIINNIQNRYKRPGDFLPEEKTDFAQGTGQRSGKKIRLKELLAQKQQTADIRG